MQAYASVLSLIVVLASAYFFAGPSFAQSSGTRVLAIGDALPYTLWNDPSVIKDGSLYRMYLSGGDLLDLTRIQVQIYEARSNDGRTWAVNPNPVLRPGPVVTDWDGLRVETPSVVKVGKAYHMYYSGFTEDGAKSGTSYIGHATSPDGVNWTKDPANPILVGQTADRMAWGYGGVGEPGVLYHPVERVFYLYYAGMRYKPTGPTIGQMGILLAKSTDGSQFTPVMQGAQRKVVLTADIPYAPSGAWFGYSTPSAILDAKYQIQLFASLVVAPGGPATARHVVVVRTNSTNGEDFPYAPQTLLQAGTGDWKDHQVRSPSAWVEGANWMVWFAGESHVPYFNGGIGYLTMPAQ